MNAIAEKVDHGQANAQGWTDTICSLVAALECDYDRLESLRDEREGLADAREDAGTATDGDVDERAQAFKDASDELTTWDEDNADELRELTEAATIEGELQTDSEAAIERIYEAPLSVEVRSGWYPPGDDAPAPEEFCILLSTGGPALRIRGDLDERGQPTRAWLEYQDWGMPWTQFYKVEQSTLLTFASQMYFGG